MKDNFCQFSIRIYVVGTHIRGDSNEYPQHRFLWRNKQNYPLINYNVLIKIPSLSVLKLGLHSLLVRRHLLDSATLFKF